MSLLFEARFARFEFWRVTSGAFRLRVRIGSGGSLSTVVTFDKATNAPDLVLSTMPIIAFGTLCQYRLFS